MDTLIQLNIELRYQGLTEEDLKNKSLIADTLYSNCRLLTNCVESIVKIRNLENFTPITSKLKSTINTALNEILIKLTDLYPLLAIEMTKIIQILALNASS